MNASEARFLGVYDSPIGKLEGRTHLDLVSETALGAAADAGLSLDAIDGLLSVKPQVGAHARHAASVAEYLGLAGQLKEYRTVDEGGASPLVAASIAFELVRSGRCHAVLVVAADTPRTGQPTQQTLQQFAAMRHPLWEQPVGITTLSAYALVADAYLSRHHLDEGALASLPVEMRRNAVATPGARFRDPLTVGEVLDSRMVSTPLRQLESTSLSDGGAAFIVGRRSLAPARARGNLRSFASATLYDSLAFAADITINGAALSIPRALADAGMSASELDVAFLYDSYSIALALQLEALGIVGDGEAPSYAEQEGLGVSSVLPVNPHGGLLSHGHCGSAAGIQHITEMVRQLRGEAANQVHEADVALVHGEGGVLSVNSTAVFSAE